MWLIRLNTWLIENYFVVIGGWWLDIHLILDFYILIMQINSLTIIIGNLKPCLIIRELWLLEYYGNWRLGMIILQQCIRTLCLLHHAGTAAWGYKASPSLITLPKCESELEWRQRSGHTGTGKSQSHWSVAFWVLNWGKGPSEIGRH